MFGLAHVLALALLALGGIVGYIIAGGTGAGAGVFVALVGALALVAWAESGG